MKVNVTIDNQTYEVEIDNLYARPVHATIEGETFEVYPELWGSQRPVRRTESAPPPQTALPPTPPASPARQAAPPPTRTAPAPTSGDGNTVNAPIPGVIVAIEVAPGDQVGAGDTLLILEAMKMKNIIRAPRDGAIEQVAVQVGQHVRHNDLLVTLADADAS